MRGTDTGPVEASPAIAVALADALKKGSSPRIPRAYLVDTSPRVSRVYLVDDGWRDPEHFGVVLASPRCTFRNLVSAACESVRGPDATDEQWALSIPAREPRIVVEDGRPRFPIVRRESATRAQVPAAVVYGVNAMPDGWEDPGEHRRYVPLIDALSEERTPIEESYVDPDSPIADVPLERPLFWSWGHSGFGTLRCITTIPFESEIEDGRAVVLSAAAHF